MSNGKKISDLREPRVIGYMPDHPDGEPLITLESHQAYVEELRALLDAEPVYAQMPPISLNPGEVLSQSADGWRVIKPATQPQGEPVAWLIQCQHSGLVEQAEPNDKSDRPDEWSDSFPVFREQPAPVAVVMPDLWQPIETAPKDGTEIILRKGDRVTSGAWTEWSKADAEFHGTTGVYLGQVEYDSGSLWASWDGGFCNDDHPTHWQPLPTATPQQ